MGERVYYRSEEEFKSAFDKAVEAIDAKRRVGRIDAAIWFGLWTVLALLYLSRWVFGWRLNALVPGVDLRSVTWILLIGYFVPFPLPRIEVEDPTSRFSPKVVFAMFEDQAGHLWFGTDGEGAHEYDGTSFRSYTTKDGLAHNLVRSIRGDRHGRIWIGTDGGGVSCYDGTSFRTFTSKDGLSNDRVFEILEDSAGNMWFSTLGAGACRYDGTSFTAFREDHDLLINGRPARGHVQEFFEDKDGILWLGCSGGLFRFDGTTFINVTRNGPWPESAQDAPALLRFETPVRSILEDSKGNYWFGSWQEGVCRFDGERYTYFTVEEGLADNASLHRVFSIGEDRAGNIWFGTVEQGAWRYDGESVRNFTEEDGVASKGVMGIYTDSRGDLWLAGEGVYKFNGESFDRVH